MNNIQTVVVSGNGDQAAPTDNDQQHTFEPANKLRNPKNRSNRPPPAARRNDPKPPKEALVNGTTA